MKMYIIQSKNETMICVIENAKKQFRVLMKKVTCGILVHVIVNAITRGNR